jgi:hypothetical protein
MLFLRSVPALMLAVFCLVSPRSASAEPWDGPDRPPMRVMTDTPEYCFYLAGRFVALQRRVADPSPDAHLLALEGRRMCEQGLVRAGIARVRRAIMILRAER